MNIKCLIFATIVGVSLGRPASEKDAKILTKEYTQGGIENAYKFKYETSNGILHEETGTLVKSTTNNSNIQFLVKSGIFRYIAPDHVQYTVSYVADENGYRPTIEKTEKTEKVETKGTGTLGGENPDDDRIGTNVLISLGGGHVG